MMIEPQSYSIQQASQMTGLSAYTLRYYEDIGLLDPVMRNTNGHRCYTEEDLGRIDLLKKLRVTGMSIEGMKQIIDLYREGSSTARARRELFEAHRDQVRAQIETLTEVLGFIDRKIAYYVEEEAQFNERNGQHHDVSLVGQTEATGH